MILRYRKRPVEVSAVKFEYTEESIKEIKVFCGNAFYGIYKNRHPAAKAELTIGTLEDGVNMQVKHIATEGDYIIKGIQGEFYPCKPAIFEATYEIV